MDQKTGRKAFDRRHLQAIECIPEGYRSLSIRLDQGEDPAVLVAELDRLLAEASPTPEQTVNASHSARKELRSHINAAETENLDALEERVLALEVGPSRLKVEIYNLARKYELHHLVESTWFNDLMERTETRRLLDLGPPEAEAAHESS